MAVLVQSIIFEMSVTNNSPSQDSYHPDECHDYCSTAQHEPGYHHDQLVRSPENILLLCVVVPHELRSVLIECLLPFP